MDKILIHTKQQNGQLIVAIDGELDAGTCMIADKEFEKALSTDADAIYVDCHELKYISSAGIGVLISFNHACAEKDVDLCFCEMQPKVRNVLEILGIDKVFTIEPSLTNALATHRPEKK